MIFQSSPKINYCRFNFSNSGNCSYTFGSSSTTTNSLLQGKVDSRIFFGYSNASPIFSYCIFDFDSEVEFSQ